MRLSPPSWPPSSPPCPWWPARGVAPAPAPADPAAERPRGADAGCAGLLRRPGRQAAAGGGQHRDHPERARSRPDAPELPQVPPGSPVRGVLQGVLRPQPPGWPGPRPRRRGAAAPAAPRSARASSSMPTATSSPTTTSSRAPRRSPSSCADDTQLKAKLIGRDDTHRHRAAQGRADKPLPAVQFGDSATPRRSATGCSRSATRSAWAAR